MEFYRRADFHGSGSKSDAEGAPGRKGGVKEPLMGMTVGGKGSLNPPGKPPVAPRREKGEICPRIQPGKTTVRHIGYHGRGPDPDAASGEG